MAQVRAEVLTPWAEIQHPVHGTIYRPLVAAEFTLSRFEDITGQPVENIIPDPNLASVLVTCEESELALVAADARLFVLWSEFV